MKSDLYGQSERLPPEQITLLFNEGLLTARDRALFGVCLYTACRINEACTLLTTDVMGKKEYLFPGRHSRGHIHKASVDKILRDACSRVGLEGVSTHSFRRTALTQMHNALCADEAYPIYIWASHPSRLSQIFGCDR